MQEFYTFQSKNLQFECLLRRTSQDESEIDLEMPKEWNGAANGGTTLLLLMVPKSMRNNGIKGRNYLLTGAGFYFFASGSGMLMDKSSGEKK